MENNNFIVMVSNRPAIPLENIDKFSANVAIKTLLHLKYTLYQKDLMTKGVHDTIEQLIKTEELASKQE